MGCFDSVYVTCPYCEGEVEIQSKADACGMRTYYEKDVNIPESIVKDIAGENECYFCEKKFLINLDYKEVTMKLPYISIVQKDQLKKKV